MPRVSIGTTNTAEFFDMFLIGFIVSDLTKPWGLTFWQSALVLLASGIGTMIGAILWGRVSDVIGRRRTLVATVLIFTVFTGLSVLTPDGGWALLAGLRLLVGIGVGGLNIVAAPTSPLHSLSDLKLTGDGGFVTVSDTGDLVRGDIRLRGATNVELQSPGAVAVDLGTP